jgi:hypothetical protein
MSKASKRAKFAARQRRYRFVKRTNKENAGRPGYMGAALSFTIAENGKTINLGRGAVFMMTRPTEIKSC